MIHTNIIKIALLTCLATITGSMYCWANIVSNETDGQILVTVEYAAPGICSPENRVLDAQTQVGIDSKICCAQTVTVRSTDKKSKVAGQSFSLETPRAGLNMTCSNFRVRVYIGANNTLMAEANLF